MNIIAGGKCETKIIKIPIELQLSAEENPSFQIGEIYLKQGEENYKEKDIGKQKITILRQIVTFKK